MSENEEIIDQFSGEVRSVLKTTQSKSIKLIQSILENIVRDPTDIEARTVYSSKRIFRNGIFNSDESLSILELCEFEACFDGMKFDKENVTKLETVLKEIEILTTTSPASNRDVKRHAGSPSIDLNDSFEIVNSEDETNQEVDLPDDNVISSAEGNEKKPQALIEDDLDEYFGYHHESDEGKGEGEEAMDLDTELSKTEQEILALERELALEEEKKSGHRPERDLSFLDEHSGGSSAEEAEADEEEIDMSLSMTQIERAPPRVLSEDEIGDELGHSFNESDIDPSDIPLDPAADDDDEFDSMKISPTPVKVQAQEMDIDLLSEIEQNPYRDSGDESSEESEGEKKGGEVEESMEEDLKRMDVDTQSFDVMEAQVSEAVDLQEEGPGEKTDAAAIEEAMEGEGEKEKIEEALVVDTERVEEEEEGEKKSEPEKIDRDAEVETRGPEIEEGVQAQKVADVSVLGMDSDSDSDDENDDDEIFFNETVGEKSAPEWKVAETKEVDDESDVELSDFETTPEDEDGEDKPEDGREEEVEVKVPQMKWWYLKYSKLKEFEEKEMGRKEKELGNYKSNVYPQVDELIKNLKEHNVHIDKVAQKYGCEEFEVEIEDFLERNVQQVKDLF